MKKYLVSFAAFLFLAACAATGDQMAAAPPSDGVAMAEATVEDPNAEVCRRVQQTGTRFHRRECKTRAEWAEEMQNAQDTTRALQRETAPNDDCLFSNQC